MFELAFRPDYADVDSMGVMHHGNYWRWLERARVDWMRHLGLPYDKTEAMGLFLPLKSCSIEFKRSLRFDEKVSIFLKVAHLGRADIEIEYEIRRGEELCTVAKTHHVLVARSVRENGEVSWFPRQIPKEWRTLWLAQNEKKHTP